MNLLTAIRKDSVEYVSAISTCARDVDVHTKMTPHAFPVEVLFTDPLIGRGPNRSTAVEKNGGVGPILRSGRGAIFCSPNLLAALFHVKQALFTALAFGRTRVIHTWARLLMTIASTPA
jgi:hypothetical protein